MPPADNPVAEQHNAPSSDASDAEAAGQTRPQTRSAESGLTMLTAMRQRRLSARKKTLCPATKETSVCLPGAGGRSFGLLREAEETEAGQTPDEGDSAADGSLKYTAPQPDIRISLSDGAGLVSLVSSGSAWIPQDEMLSPGPNRSRQHGEKRSRRTEIHSPSLKLEEPVGTETCTPDTTPNRVDAFPHRLLAPRALSTEARPASSHTSAPAGLLAPMNYNSLSNFCDSMLATELPPTCRPASPRLCDPDEASKLSRSASSSASSSSSCLSAKLMKDPNKPCPSVPTARSGGRANKSKTRLDADEGLQLPATQLGPCVQPTSQTANVCVGARPTDEKHKLQHTWL
ncbi:unnamed protein product [Protopolystoma xenopodis]|uniref:Uncharacterized protein n=1 Tax=Protopolystoma xenopodis TaxID=117903 RepID=A0A3S5AG01_9PLAT|nr:unnamed protein product [Protopolystoma xenopodis]